jgi:uncharacterized protein YjbI with pentapeptide repeats
MKRDKTVALFLECEAKRLAGRVSALAEGETETESRKTAHKAAKEHWNAWAQALLDKRKEMETSGAWAAENDASGKLMGKNEATCAWLKNAKANFSRCLFLVAGANGKHPGEDNNPPESGDLPLKSVAIDGASINFAGFIFPGGALFDNAAFSGDCSFGEASFLMNASFTRAAFRRASFQHATFSGRALFDIAIFEHTALFEHARFFGDTSFFRVQFLRNAAFDNALFHSSVAFNSASFLGDAWFEGAVFKAPASFRAIRGEREFTMADAVFEGVPDFIQAHFSEAPRLDSLRVRGCVEKPHRDIPSSWRALQRLALQGHDTNRELEFHAREIRSERRVDDWPFPRNIRDPQDWAGVPRYYAGWVYQLSSDFGRSLVRPMTWWLITLVISAIFYLGQNDDVVAKRAQLEEEGHTIIGAYVLAGYDAAMSPPACFGSERASDQDPKALPDHDPKEKPRQQRIGLVDEIAGKTNAAREAMQLAFRNGALGLDSSGDGAHRTYGCLYGFELFGKSRTAYVPNSVSIAASVQKILSAIFIFLFGLALRNMLKMK